MDICLSVQKINHLVIGVVITLVLFLPLISWGQTQVESPWALRAFAHINISNIPKFPETYFSNAHAGAGLYGAYRLNPKYDFQIGLKLNTVAYSRNAKDSLELYIQRIREYYLDLPLSLYYYTNPDRTWGFYGGATPSILLNKSINRKEDNPAYYNLPSDPSKRFRFDFALHLGTTVKINPRFNASLTYTHSLTSNQIQPYNSGRFSQFDLGVGFLINAPAGSKPEKTKVPETSPFKESSVIILVRLKTEAKKIAYYESRGYVQDAKELREKVNEENSLTVEAFQKGYTYGEVRYFYDTASAQIAAERYDGLLFDGSGQRYDSSILDTLDILIVEFGSPYSEAFGSSSGFGLVVYDYHFNQMKEPFPFYVSTQYGLVSRKEAVIRFDKKLREYFIGN